MLVNEAEELEQVNESAFARLMASNIDESRCVAPQVSKYPVPSTGHTKFPLFRYIPLYVGGSIRPEGCGVRAWEPREDEGRFF